MRTVQGFPNINAADGTNPYGTIRDNPGDNSGTPVNAAVYGDIHTSIARLFDLAGITPNQLPENNSNGFQFITALQKYISENILSVTETADANNCIKTGFYDVLQSSSNKPLTQQGYLIAQAFNGFSGAYVSQFWFEHTSDRVFFRRRTASVWTAWLEILTQGFDQALTLDNTLQVVSGIRTKSSGNFFKVDQITVNDWDMDTTGTKLVTHGLTASKIIDVSVYIQDSVVGKFYNLMNSGKIVINSTQLELSRTAGGDFDNTSFINTAIKIKIEYEA